MYRRVSLLILLLCSSQSWAERTLLSGELGAWLAQTAIPELTDTLARHPKFSGEPIRIAAVNGSQVSTHRSALADAIRQQLTHAVLRHGKNDVANSQDPAQCNKVPTPVHYLVGIRIEPVSRSNHRVSLAVLDLENFMWVSGISLTWQGRLLSSERAALATPLQSVPAGSVENPLRLTAHAALTRALYTQLECRLPRDLDGSLYVTRSAQQDLQLVLHDLQDRLALSARAVSRDAEQANWLLHANLQDIAEDRQRLTLSLRRHGQTGPGQLLASIYVSAQRQHARRARAPIEQPDQLLSELQIPAATLSCRQPPCTEIRFDLRDDAYLLVFRTHQGRVAPLSCGRASGRKNAGEQRYRIQSAAQQRVGFYVIASRERQPIQALQQRLRAAPGACDKPAGADLRWLRSTLTQMNELQGAIEWRAVHLIDTPQGPQLL